jgi:periplasmic protein TonB
MKKILLTIIASVFLLAAKAQSSEIQSSDIQVAAPDYDKVFTSAEKTPEFPGGLTGFNNYLARTIRYPSDARAGNIQGRVIITMIVEKDGSLSNIKVVKGVYPSLDNEAIRVLKISPKWNPAMQNGHLVRFSYATPISFKLVN